MYDIDPPGPVLRLGAARPVRTDASWAWKGEGGSGSHSSIAYIDADGTVTTIEPIKPGDTGIFVVGRRAKLNGCGYPLANFTPLPETRPRARTDCFARSLVHVRMISDADAALAREIDRLREDDGA